MMVFNKLLAYAVNKRFLALFVAPNLLFAALAIATDAQPFIAVLNLIVTALAVNVCVAFGPNVLDAIFSDRVLDKADLLSLGIFCSWFAIVLRTTWSLSWRWLGEPRWMNNTDFTSYFIFLTVCAGVYHLLAPGSLKESVPPLRWVKIGAWIAIGVFLGLLVIYASDLQNDWKRFTTPNDHATTPSAFIQLL